MKLAGVQMAEGWDDHGREMLHKIIDESDGVKVNLTSCEANSPGLLTTVFLLTTLGFTMGKFQSFPTGSVSTALGMCLPPTSVTP